jgi:hypothetical protein
MWLLAEARGRQAEREKLEADRQRDRAKSEREFARQVVDDMYTKVAEKWLSSAPGLQPLQREFLEKALGFYDRANALKFRQVTTAAQDFFEKIRVQSRHLAFAPQAAFAGILLQQADGHAA